ncbi:MAG: tRNA (adenosine(37)-N6)-threonylcarbamoyltransferase complex ATPase subunit type 1 TsaE, partial [Mariprofundaceae bacterium]
MRLASEAETRQAAADLAKYMNPGNVVALQGELGAGKSVFARALMRALGVTDEVMPSPTFTLIQTYEGEGCKIAHMDWYRLESSEEIELLGVRDYFQPPWISLIEWPERAESLLPPDAVRVHLECVDENPDVR